MSRLDRHTLEPLLRDSTERALTYLATLDERPVGPTAEALGALGAFDEVLPDGPGDPRATVELLDRVGSPATVASNGGRYFGFVIGGALPAAMASSWVATAWDQNSALPVMSPVAAKLHQVTTRWLVELLRLPPATTAVFVTGASMANVTALTAARDAQLARAGWDVQAEGLFGAPEITVVVGEKAHSTVVKALGVIGLGRNRVVTIPADDQGRLQPHLLPAKVQGPAIVCAQAGEVNTGAFDPFNAIAEWARSNDAWLHVDGAFGLWAAVDPTRQHLTAGLDRADSWATDGHKWLNVGYDCGIAFARRPEDLRRSFASTAGYLPPDDGRGFEVMHHSPAASQRARQIEVWAALRSLGRAGVTDLVQRTCRYAETMAAGLDHAGLHVLNQVVLNQVLVRDETDEATRALVEAVQADGTCWCGPTTWGGRPAMRISVSGWATDEADVVASVRAITAARHAARPHAG